MHEAALKIIVHPALAEAFDADWYYPWPVEEWPREDCEHPAVQPAIAEGWSEWIECQADLEAVKQGYVYDLSRDRNGQPVYWFHGSWCRWEAVGGGKRQLIKIPLELAEREEDPEVVYFGRGDIACRFVEVFFHYTKESMASDPGELYRLIHWQRKLLLTVFGWVRHEQDRKGRPIRVRRYRQALVELSKKNGKLLSDDTRIPTPDGWKNHGDLRVGDALFDRHGRPCEVVAVHEKGVADYEVEFTNGQTIKCSGEHRWVTESLRTTEPSRAGRRDGGRARIGAYLNESARTTLDIARTLKTSQGALSHRVRMQDGIECNEVVLPLSPYALGYWLGDGSSYRADITMAAEVEVEVCSILKSEGLFIRKRSSDGSKLTLSFDLKPSKIRDKSALWAALKSLNVDRNKHIPSEYLRAARDQRLSLLQGLMDSDGTISKDGKCCVFVQKSKTLADGFCELLSSLGIKYSTQLKRKKCTNNGAIGSYYMIQFHVFRDEHCCFRLRHKADRLRSRSALQMRTGRSRHVHIKSIRPIEPVVGNCITVSSEDGTYLCGETMIPTHNSDLGSIITILLTRGDNTRKAYVYGVACDKNQAGIVFREAKDYVAGSPFLSSELFVNDSRVDRKISHFATGSFYEVVSADAFRNDGYDAHGVVFDELHQQKNRQLYVIFRRSGQARVQPLEFVITTYGKTLKGIWGEVHLKAKAQLQERRTKISQYVMIASAEEFPVVIMQNALAGDELLTVRRLEQPIDAGEVIEFESSQAGGNIKVRTTAVAKRFQRFLEVEPIASDIPLYSEGIANQNPLAPDRLDHAIRRANPSVDIVTSHERIKEEIMDAEGPQGEAEAKRFNLNIIAGDGNLWLSGAAWMACGRQRILMSSLLKQRCFGGLDISQINDLTAFWLAFPNWKHGVKFGKVRTPLVKLIGLVWVPSEEIEKREEVEEIPYRALAQQRYIGRFGPVRICEGSTIDYEQVGTEIVELCEYFKCQAIGYDPAYSRFVAEPYLEAAGLKCHPHRQGALSMGPASQRFENMLKKHQISHGHHPVLDLAVEGCVLKTADAVGNRYPAKDKSLSRIDPIIAAIMANGWACDPPEECLGSGAWSGAKGSGVFG
jgi:phage terminase large subunit-like protein